MLFLKQRFTKVKGLKQTFFFPPNSLQGQIEKEWWDINSLFTAVLAVVEAAKAKALSPLEDKLQLLKKESNDMKYDLEDEIKRLETTILKLEEISALEDHILFLQVRCDSIFF